ncbi:MAG: hypothetical protein ABI623_00905 [bacterium]
MISMTKPRYLLLLVLGLAMAGCTHFQMTLTDEERSFPATSPGTVQLFYPGEEIPAFKEVGYIVVDEKSEDEGVSFLQKKAAAMGADAIANLEVKIQTQTIFIVVIPIPVHSYFVSGTAIKYIK